jgi:hypothetical protein
MEFLTITVACFHKVGKYCCHTLRMKTYLATGRKVGEKPFIIKPGCHQVRKIWMAVDV